MPPTVAIRRHGSNGGRRAAVLSLSLGLHVLLLVALLLVGRRAYLREEAPASVEMQFEAAPPGALPISEPAESVTPESAAAALPEQAEALPPVPLAAVPAEPDVAPAAAAADLPAPSLAEAAPAPFQAVQPPAQVIPPPPSPARAVSRPAPRRATVPPAAPERPALTQAQILPTAPTLPVPAAPLPASAAVVSDGWSKALAAWIRSRKTYPEEARRLGREGGAIVRFTVGRDGRVQDAQLVQGSGSDLLDQAALSMFRAAQVPAFPQEMLSKQITVTVPIRFRLQD